MLNIIRNAAILFKRNKDFIWLITVQPILLYLIMSFLLAYSTTHKVGVINNDSGEVGKTIFDRIDKVDGVEIQEVLEEEVAEKIYSGSIELAVVIGKSNTNLIESDGISDVSIIAMEDSEIEPTISFVVDETINVALNGNEEAVQLQFTENEVKSKGMTISYSLAFMIFKTVTAGSVLATVLVNERKNKIRDRMILSGISTNKYLGGISIVYLLFMMGGSLLYYIFALLFDFDFGMKNSLGFLIMLIMANLLSVAVYAFAATLVKDDGALWFMGTLILMPMGLISGVAFPFHLMPEIIQKIANFFPLRWIALGVENIQRSGEISSALPNILMIVGLCCALYFITIVRIKQLDVKKN